MPTAPLRRLLKGKSMNRVQARWHKGAFATLCIVFVLLFVIPLGVVAAPVQLLEFNAPNEMAEKPDVSLPGLAIPDALTGGTSLPLEIEPNGTSATATPIGATSTRIKGTVFPAADVDFYSFTAAAGDRIYAATQTLSDASASGDSTLQLLASDGSTLIEEDANDGTFNASSSSIAGVLIPTAGTYYLRVTHNLATGTIRPYFLNFTQQSAAPTPEVEPNQTQATATPLPASGHVSGTVSAVSPGESDFYSINLAAGDTVYLSLDMNPERDAAVWNGRLGFGLFGNAPANQILLANDANTGATASNPNSEAFFFTVKDAGTYFVYVDSIVAAGVGATATYNLSVSVLPAPTPVGACTTYTSTNVPQTIPTGPGSVSSTLTIPGNPRIADLNVELNLDHTFMQDIDAHLISPAGNDNGLFTDIGAATVGGPQTSMNLVFDDEAGLPPAFTLSASFHVQPELAYRLSWFDGEDAGGTWTLQLRDDATGDGGTLNSWSITVCEPPPPPSCPAGTASTTVYSTDFESGAAGFTHSGAADEWELGLPTFVPITTCNSGTNCWKTDLDNTYDASSSQDLLSPNINLAGLQPPVLVRWSQRYHVESRNFDGYSVTAQEVGGANPVRLFEWLDATMNNTVGNPAVTIAESAGWAQFTRQVDSLAGTNAELLFRLTSDTTVQLAGAAIDDVSVTACRALSADLSITKTDGVTTAVPGGNVTYTITGSNAGPDPVTGATIADTFPASLTCTWTCVGAGGGTCTAAGSGNISDTVNLPTGGSVTYTASCAINASATGTLVNTATVSSSITDPTPGNNSATDTDTLTPQADLSITKTDGVTSVVAGGSTIYTITASNAGPSNAPGSTVADTFPASLTCTWTCVGAGGGTCTPAGAGNISDVVNLPAGGSTTFTATCNISAAATGSIVNTATVAAAAGVTDTNPANNSATDTDTVLPPGVLGVNPTSIDFGTIAIGATSAAQTVTLSNTGGSPLQVTALSAAAAPFALSGGTCGAVPFSIGVGLSCTLDYTFSPTVSGPASQNLTVTSSVGNGAFSLTGTGGIGIIGVLSATVDFGSLVVGSSSQLALTILNTGTGPLQVTAISTPSAPFAEVPGGTCGAVPFGLAAGANCTVLYSFSPVAPGLFSEVITITSDVGTATATLSGEGLRGAVAPVDLDVLSNWSSLLLMMMLGMAALVAMRRHY
ncbi:MAG: choice-of-anchor D domain-containing protein [Gammaproteobacteria bacterium]|nr:MAG: choice-of-anchor D domain-containing protein [Gammaproteobacteria bacterium]